MQKHVDFCKSHVEADGRFGDLMNKVHIDEKWYYHQQIDEKCYLMSDEEMPLRTCKHKPHIDKVMFRAAVARPRYNHHIWKKYKAQTQIMAGDGFKSSANRDPDVN
jgi:hypothetical protein